jgi:hypothetical protein
MHTPVLLPALPSSVVPPTTLPPPPAAPITAVQVWNQLTAIQQQSFRHTLVKVCRSLATLLSPPPLAQENPDESTRPADAHR